MEVQDSSDFCSHFWMASRSLMCPRRTVCQHHAKHCECIHHHSKAASDLQYGGQWIDMIQLRLLCRCNFAQSSLSRTQISLGLLGGGGGELDLYLSAETYHAERRELRKTHNAPLKLLLRCGMKVSHMTHQRQVPPLRKHTLEAPWTLVARYNIFIGREENI